MTNEAESVWRLRDARVELQSAEKNLAIREFVPAVHFAQLCVENAVKAVIACFSEPEWGHNPGKQLRDILDDRRAQVVAIFGEDFLSEFLSLADAASKAAPWHVWSTYGKQEPGKPRISAVDLCTEVVAQEMLTMAREAHRVADRFVTGWVKAAQQNDEGKRT